MHNKKGFTLVEILIVVIILGILAAIVIPQFTEASNDARDSALVSDLQTLRSQIELYKIQHLDNYPGQAGADITTVAAADFVTDLTSKTNVEGNQVAGAGEGAVILGTYLQSFPRNPFVSASPANIQITVAAGVPAGDNSTGWHLNTNTGLVSPNDTSSTTGGTAHTAL